MKNPCKKDCKGRSADCHVMCGKYREYYEWNQQRIEQEARERKAEQALCEESNKRAARIQRSVRKDIRLKTWGT